MRIDPFAVKVYPRSHPFRLAYTAWARSADWWFRFGFSKRALPDVLPDGPLPEAPKTDWKDTQVTPRQAQHLLYALETVEHDPGCVLEIGCWRGITTSYLAAHTNAPVFAVDPYIGPFAEPNFRVFQQRTQAFPHVHLIRKPCGAALKDWSYPRIKFAFIDGSHDYANVAHDLERVRALMQPGGLIALHDTDNPVFPGCRKAVYDQRNFFNLFLHVKDLTIFQYEVAPT